ncbi:MAG: DNA-processing protein DprA, partial [bacterium]
LLNVYPSKNKPLFEKICENGAVISEFPLDTPPFKDNFPRRNRIIAGLSLGCVVVEAKERSGALITARLAMESGREVFAVPGEITKETSKGTNKLIKEGVKPVCDVLDIIEELGHIVEIK